MKKSEIILLIVTLIVMGGGLYLFLSPEEGAESSAAAVTASDLVAVRDTFQKNLKLLKNGTEINDEFMRFAVSMEDTKTNGDPGMAATTQLYNVLHDKLKIPQPDISVSREEPIKNVEDYYFINVRIKVAGTEADMKKLLRNMEQLGFLIKSFKLNLQGRGNDYLELEVVVSRLIKHDPDSRKRMGLDKKGGSLRRIQR